jgi:hypothetical protein
LLKSEKWQERCGDDDILMFTSGLEGPETGEAERDEVCQRSGEQRARAKREQEMFAGAADVDVLDGDDESM